MKRLILKKNLKMFMKRIILLLVIILTVMEVSSQSLTIITYNIRMDNPADGQNSWPLRKTWLCGQIRSCAPDIFGIQEGLPRQVDFIDSSFSGFKHVGVGREDGKRKGEFSAIYYNTTKFKVLKQSTFWLSPTPGKPSVGWDAACIRICTYGLFRNISTGYKFWVFNTHLDHIGVEARKNSAILIIKKITELNKQGLPVILMGDFNGGPDSEPIVYLSARLYDSKLSVTDPVIGTQGTFNNFDVSTPATERIDFVFTNKKGLVVTDYTVLRESKDGRYPSDHLPVIVKMKVELLKKP